MRSKSFEDLLTRIRGEYAEMPGLRLTADQGDRLWGLDHGQCEELLSVLVYRGFLAVDGDGKYARLVEDGMPVMPGRVAKATLKVRAQPKAVSTRKAAGSS